GRVLYGVRRRAAAFAISTEAKATAGEARLAEEKAGARSRTRHEFARVDDFPPQRPSPVPPARRDYDTITRA
ncbi:MAG: hypothetical protein WB680_18675, partial [Candidatus Acidiferrales bacterium]